MKNIKKTCILSLALINLLGVNFVQAREDVEKKYNATRVSTNNYMVYNYNTSKEKFDDFWTEGNITLLSLEEAKTLNELKNKVENNIILSLQETQYLKSLKNKVIRQKLGEEKYKELEKLIKKRDSSVELTLPERERIYKLNKECR